MPNLVLYKFDSCPFCQKVQNYIQANQLAIPTKDTMESRAYREELRAAGGKSQVPCLMIDGNTLYESDDIIDWLKENQEHIKKV